MQLNLEGVFATGQINTEQLYTLSLLFFFLKCQQFAVLLSFYRHLLGVTQLPAVPRPSVVLLFESHKQCLGNCFPSFSQTLLLDF